MKHKAILLFGFLLINHYLSGQVTVSDQKVIKYCKVVNLTDTINYPFKEKFFKITIQYFLDHGLNPKDYYLQYPAKGQKIDEKVYIEFFNMNALRDWYNGDKNNFHHVGGFGSPGDDIQVAYDSKFENILSITNSE